MKQLLIAFLLLILAATACSLGDLDTTEPTPTVPTGAVQLRDKTWAFSDGNICSEVCTATGQWAIVCSNGTSRRSDNPLPCW